METQKSRFMSLGFISLALLAASGCSTSGGKQEPVVDHESAQRDLKGSVSDLNNRAQAAFKDMGIDLTGTQLKNSGNEQDLTGTAGDKNVTVELTGISNGMTHVDVSAKEGTFQWNQDYANNVLSKIIEKS
jgi:hypothetical protein